VDFFKDEGRSGPVVLARAAANKAEVGSAARSSHAPRAVTLFAAVTNSVRRFPVNLERSSCELVFKEMEMNVKTVSGASMAAAAIAVVLSGAAPAPALAKKMSKSVHCAGINSCKGTSACKTANNACKGMNSCKGQGWVPEKSAAACEAKGGKVAEM
jgi:hypothetical protein